MHWWRVSFRARTASGEVNMSRISRAILVAVIGGAVGLVGTQSAAAGTGFNPVTFNRAGDVLIADQFNNRVIEVNAQHKIVWQFGKGPNDFTSKSIIGVNDAQRVGNDTLMAGTGTPAGVVAQCPSGCPDNRVVLVDPFGNIVWQYGRFTVSGAGFDQLNTPVQATWLPDGDVLITDQANERIIEVNLAHQIVWQYGQTGVTGIGEDQLNNPNSAELLANGHILIADENNNRVIEVTRQHHIVWQYPATPDPTLLSGAAFASRLPNGHTVITDSNNNRIIEVTRAGVVTWSYLTNTQSGSNPAPLPTRAIRLHDGDTIISDQFNDRVIVVDPTGSIERQDGLLNTIGYSTTTTAAGLNAPYDAKVIDDYTGLTNPF
jgi:hypothetical protein